MSSLRDRRMTIVADPSQPQKPTHTQATFNLSALSSKSQGIGASVKRQITNPGGYLKKTESSAGNGKGKKKDERKSRVSDRMKKRLSMRYEEASPSMNVPPVPRIQYDSSSFPRASGGGLDAETDPIYHDPTITPNGLEKINNSFAAFAFPSDSAPSRRSKLGMPDGGQTTREEEFVRPRGSVMPGRIGGIGRDRARGGEEDYDSGYGVEVDSGRRRWDFEGLKKEGTDVNTFIGQTLAGAEKDEVVDFKKALADRKVENAGELKQKVFKNYAHFVTIAKEISLLENDMLELKDMLNEWKSAPALLGSGVGSGGGGAVDEMFGGFTLGEGGGNNVLERRKTVRNSVLDLENLYKSQIQGLWSQISGSQKFLPYAPGRHLICEASNFVELNPATYKVKQTVELFLLNDLLLVAVRKRKRSEGSSSDARGGGSEGEKTKGRLVAERCWNLNEVVVVDVKDSGDLTNAIKIRRGKESFVYRTNFPDDKKVLLGAFRKVAEDLASKKRKESEKEQERRKSMWAGDMLGGKPSEAGPVPKLPRGSGNGATEVPEWLETFEDDLTMAIAVRNWEEAIRLAKRGRTYIGTGASKAFLPNNATAARLIALVRELKSQLAYDLSLPDVKRSTVVKVVAYLVELEESQLASDKFLEARKELLQKRLKMIAYLGDVPAYISELGVVTFTILKHTVDWYLTAFRENRMISSLVKWSDERVREFAETFRRQVYGPLADPNVIDDSLRITAYHNRKLLRDSGLDFTFLLAVLLQPNPEDPLVMPNTTITDFASRNASAVQSPAVPQETRLASNRQAPASQQQQLLDSPDPNVGSASPRPPPRSERRARPARSDNRI